MTDYVKSTNFASKDSLASGNPLKIVKGTEIDTEFNNIATAVATKLDSNGGTLTSGTISGGSISGITDLAVADGGTGASTAADARTNLSAAKSGANSDITSLTGLTTALSVAQGGTGSTSLTANNVLLGNGTSAVQAVAPGTSGNVLKSNGTTWTSAAPDPAIGVNQTWQDVTSSRSGGTWYQNTTGKPVQVSVNTQGGDGGSAALYVGTSTSSYVTVASKFQMGANTVQQLTAIVPNNHYYYIAISSESINVWAELR